MAKSSGAFPSAADQINDRTRAAESIDLQCIDESIQHVRLAQCIDRNAAAVIPTRPATPIRRATDKPRPVPHPLPPSPDLDWEPPSIMPPKLSAVANAAVMSGNTEGVMPITRCLVSE